MPRMVSFKASDSEFADITFYMQARHLTSLPELMRNALFAFMRQSKAGGHRSSKQTAGEGAEAPDRGREVSAPPSLSSLNSLRIQEAKKEYSPDVHLLSSEHDRLVRQYGAKNTAAAVAKLSAYKQATGKTYKSDYGAILSWAMRSVLEKGSVPAPTVEEQCPECHVRGGSHGAFCTRKPA